MTHDTELMPAEACSDFLSDPPDQQKLPEGHAIATIWVAAITGGATLLALWLAGVIWI